VTRVGEASSDRPDTRGGPGRRRRGEPDIQRANDYVLGVVLFSVALFFAGISSRLGAPGPGP